MSTPIISLFSRPDNEPAEGDPVFFCTRANARGLESLQGLMNEANRLAEKNPSIYAVHASPARFPPEALLDLGTYKEPTTGAVGAARLLEEVDMWTPRTRIVQDAPDKYVEGACRIPFWSYTIVAEFDRIHLYTELQEGPAQSEEILHRLALVEVYLGLMERTTDPEEHDRMLGWLREHADTLSNRDLMAVGRAAPEWLRDNDLVRISQDPDAEIRAFLTEAIAQRGRGAKMSGGVRR